MIHDYSSIEIWIAAAGTNGYPLLVSGPGGKTNGNLKLPTDDTVFESLTARLAALSLDENGARELGERLFELLFVGKIKDIYTRTQSALNSDQGLRLEFVIDPQAIDVAVLPWELLYEPGQGPLALRGISIVRYLPQQALPPTLAVDLPLKVLLTSAQTLPPTSSEREFTIVREALAGLGNDVQVQDEACLTRAKLQDFLRQDFHIWHFVGHGSYSDNEKDAQLMLQDESNDNDPVDASELANYLSQSVHLVVLEACEGATPATDPLRSLALALIQARVPAVVAMQFKIPEETARAFARQFYRTLAEGHPIDACVTEGRRAMMGFDRPDWAIPVFYTGAKESWIFRRPKQSAEPRADELEYAISHSAASTAEALPTGIVTFLLTKIEDSARLWRQHPAETRQALARYDDLFQGCIGQHRGFMVQTRDEDGNCVIVFDQATDAVAAACALQQVLYAEAWPPQVSLRVRMALHTGEANLRDGNYIGPAVSRCAQLREIGHAGQMLLSSATAELVRDNKPRGVELQDHGEYYLEDRSASEKIFLLVIPGIPSDFSPLQAPRRHSTNLPSFSTRLIGREHEVKDMKRLLKKEGVQALTLTGPGGVGKTRLAVGFAEEARDEFADGVKFVDLALSTDYGLMLHRIAQELDVQGNREQSLINRLGDCLHGKEILLVLDKFEHVQEAAHDLERLLAAAPRLKVLVTSRIVLNIEREQCYELQPLGLPALRHLPPIGKLRKNAAVALFIARAELRDPRFQLTDKNAGNVAKICNLLDGLPLAIELAAASIDTYSPEQLLGDFQSHLGSRLRLREERLQLTLADTIAWSYLHLREDEQRLFRELGVFVGGCRRNAVAAVCRAEGTATSEEPDRLKSLRRKSLLQHIKKEGSEARYAMLDTIREYALERLRDSGEETLLRQRHADYFLEQAKIAAPGLEGPTGPEQYTYLEDERGNLHAALRWLIDQELAEPALRLGVALWRFWYTRGYLSEGLSLLKEALELADRVEESPNQKTWANAYAAASGLAWACGTYDLAHTYDEIGRSLFRDMGDKAGEARMLNLFGVVVEYQSDYEQAEKYYQESLKLYQQSLALHEQSFAPQLEIREDKVGMARVLGNLGVVARRQRNFSQAQEFYEQCRDLFKEIGNSQGEATVLCNQAEMALLQQDYSQAYTLYLQSLELCYVSKDKVGIPYCLEGLMWVAVKQDQLERAACLWGVAEMLRHETGESLLEADGGDYMRMAGEARARIGEAKWNATYAKGHTMDFEQIIVFAHASNMPGGPR